MPAKWSIAAATSIGTSHLRTGTECQDAHRCGTFPDADGDDILCAVVSDGAGSVVMSSVGAEIASQAMLGNIRNHLASGGRLADFDRQRAADWVAGVREAIAATAESTGFAVVDYSCTLLCAFVGPDCAVTIQIGDGAIVFGEGPKWSWVHWPQHGEYANQTFFCTDADAAARMQFSCVQGVRVDEIAIFSDGIEPLVLQYSDRSVHGKFFDAMMPSVRATSVEGIDMALSTALRGYLDSPAITSRTDDDKTLVLASRRASSAAAQARP